MIEINYSMPEPPSYKEACHVLTEQAMKDMHAFLEKTRKIANQIIITDDRGSKTVGILRAGKDALKTPYQTPGITDVHVKGFSKAIRIFVYTPIQGLQIEHALRSATSLYFKLGRQDLNDYAIQLTTVLRLSKEGHGYEACLHE